MAGAKAKSILVTAAAVVVGMGLLFLLIYRVFWAPYMELGQEWAQAEEELEKKEKEFRNFEAKKKRLQRARLTSFPVNTKVWPTEYEAYLRQLTKDFTEKTIAAPVITTEPKAAAGKKVQAGQIIRTWNIRGKAKWSTLVAMLEKFQHTPLLHRIKSIHVERPTATSDADKKPFVDELVVSITIETLSMLRGERRPENLWGVDPRVLAVDTFAGLGLGRPGWSMLWSSQVLTVPEAPLDRKYDILDYRNPFRGGLTPTEIAKINPPQKAPESQPEEVQPEPIEGEDVRKYVRLVKIYESTLDIAVEVKRGVVNQSPWITYEPGMPVAVSPGKAKSADYFIDLQSCWGDHRADRIDSISPAGKGVSAVLVRDSKGRDGNLKITVRPGTELGIYMIKLHVKRALLYNTLTEQYTTLSTRTAYDSFLVKSENGRGEWARGKVIYIDHQDIYLVSKDVLSKSVEGIYRMHTGAYLFDALQRQLTPAEVQKLDWWAQSPLAASTLGLLAAPGPGPLLASFTLYPGRPGLRSITEKGEPVVFGRKADKIGE